MKEANAAPSDPLVGSRIDGRYSIRGVLGHGGMGVVYDGVHDDLGRAVAIKVLNTAWAADRTAVERFLREARTASSFSHANIVDVSDLGRLPDGRPYLVMPKITGTDLNTLLGDMGPLPAKRVADLLGGVAGALDLIHAKGYVHRDIKPENLMYVSRDDGSETVMLLDFGIAKLVMSTEPRLTGQGAVFGTPHFMPPEAWGGGAPDASGDVYALATVVFELITGSLPFESDNVMQLLTLKIGRDAPSLREVAARDFPHELETVMARALARKAQLRFASATEFVNALKAATEFAPVSWRPGVLRSSLHSGQHLVERHLTPSIHVKEDAFVADQDPLAHDDADEIDDPNQDLHDMNDMHDVHDMHDMHDPIDDETTRDTQRSLPGRRTLEAHARWQSPDLSAGLRAIEPYDYRPSRSKRRRSAWPGITLLLLVAGAVVIGLRFSDKEAAASSASSQSASNNSTQSAEPATTSDQRAAAPAAAEAPGAIGVTPPEAAAATNDSVVSTASSTETTPIKLDTSDRIEPLNASPKSAESETPASSTAPAAPVATPSGTHRVAAPAAPAPAVPPPIAGPALTAVAPSLAPKPTILPEPATIRGAETESAPLKPGRLIESDFIPEPFAPEPANPDSVTETSASSSTDVLVVKQEAPEPEHAPLHDSAKAKQLTQQATTALLRGEVARAVELLTQAAEADPSQAAAWRTLGVALERAGNGPGAIHAYQRYLSLAPSGTQADMVRERIQALQR